MIAKEFIKKWKNSLNHLGLPSIGIHVGWDLINLNPQVNTLSGEEAWNLLYDCKPPWFKKPQTFRELLEKKNSDYYQIVSEETSNGKIEYYRHNGLREPVFCIFERKDGSFKLLGDGNHRFFDCIYLINKEKQDFDSDIKKTKVDVIYLSNFDDVLKTNIIWNQQL